MIRSLYVFVKYLFLYLCSIIFLATLPAFSQTVPAKKLIEEFKIDDASQTQSYGELCFDLVSNFDQDRYDLQVKALQKYLQKNKDNRVKIRLFMYERSAYLEKNQPDPFNTPEHYLEVIKLASSLGDEQLLSELYFKYALFFGPSKKLYYLLKSIEIRERLGVQYFSDISSGYYWASELFYHTGAYESSGKYAARSLVLFKENERQIFLLQYILAADLAGDSYLKINKPDSAIYYYKHIGSLVDERLANPDKYESPMSPEVLQVWRGVVKGGVGKAYLLQKKYDVAYDLLLENLKSSRAYKQWGDVAGVLNELAKIDLLRQNTTMALSRYMQAYHLALKDTKLSILVNAAEGISSAFAVQQQYDSAYVYQKKHFHWKEIIDHNINQSRLDEIKAQVDFENMQKVLVQTQNNVINEKRIRNFILIAIVCLTVVALLLYNRKHLRMSLQHEKLKNEKQSTEAQIINARQQIDFFTQSIAEKNNLIEYLQTEKMIIDNAAINFELSQFTILTEEDWQKFKTSFETINPGFLQRLKHKMPQITQGEQRIIFLSKLGLTTKEMANATGVSPETIRSVSSRMRKKFNLNKDLQTIAKEV